MLRIHMNLGRSESRHRHELQVGISNQFPSQPKEWLLEVVVTLRRDIVVLKVLLPVKDNRLCLDFPVLDVDFVSTQSNGYVFTDSNQISMPVGNVFVGDSGGDIEHDDRTLTLNVVSVSKSSEFLLTSSIPDIESNHSSVCMESQGMDFNS